VNNRTVATSIPAVVPELLLRSVMLATRRLLICLAGALCIETAAGYSVLTHEAIIDSVWESSFQRVLKKRFPKTSAEQLTEAHAYAYGGSLIQDMGYYPFGSRLFSDLTHYIRSGDFVEALLQEAKDVNELAFALGALEHYVADDLGHPMAINRSVPILYPKLRKKFGDVATYEQSPKAHVKVEFGFDVLQVARGRYKPEAYQHFVGFEIAEDLLKRAFSRTYGLELDDLFGNLDLALGTYRYMVSTLIPQLTRVAWETKKEEIERLVPEATRERFLYSLSRRDYEKQWGTKYKKPGMKSKLLAAVLRIIPKVGPFQALSFKPPTKETEKMFLASFDATAERYRGLLLQAADGRLDLPNENLDTGRPARPQEYELADKAYARLLKKAAEAGARKPIALETGGARQ
jgi:hypothetical protein